MKFQDDISNMNTYTHTHTHTHTHTDKPKPICPPLFQSWGHNKQHRDPHQKYHLGAVSNIKLLGGLNRLKPVKKTKRCKKERHDKCFIDLFFHHD